MAGPLALDVPAVAPHEAAVETPTVELPEVLPPLRDDLRLIPGPAAADGSPTWTIFDPARNRYIRIGWLAFQVLTRWHLGKPEAVINAVAEETAGTIDRIELAGLIRFFENLGLVMADQPDVIRRLEGQFAASRPSIAAFLLHRYLFVRIPVLRPDRLLHATSAFVRPLFSAGFVGATALLGLIGLLLVMRQWDAFLATFWHFFSIEGVIFFAITLVGLKIVHELAHAYTAHRYGCRIPTMGVALLVFWPVLYTDTTDAWRLTSRRKRLNIGAAGMAIELLFACLATFLWSFLPEGLLKTACFFVATIAWVMTLAINLNPCMKFDGYYLLADWLGVENLQDRSFALARWRMRELLFGFGEPPPERIRPSMQRWLLVYAYATWLWRIVLFIGIAFLIYHAFFKALGLFLMVVEVGWFLLRPGWREAKEWWKRRDRMQWNRHTIGSVIVLAGVIVFLAVPWKGFVSVPAVLSARADTLAYAPVPGRLAEVRVTNGDVVSVGDVLFVLESPRIEHDIVLAEQRIRMVAYERQTRAASGLNLDTLTVLEQELAAGMSKLAGLREVMANLEIRADVAGVVQAVELFVRPGLWVAEDLPLARIVDSGASRVTGYVASHDLGRLEPGAPGRFYPDDPGLATLAVTVTAIETIHAETLTEPYLASVYGGHIAVDAVSPDAPLVPHDPVYRVFFAAVDDSGAPNWKTAGTVRVEGESRSLFDRMWRQVAAVLIRESGF